MVNHMTQVYQHGIECSHSEGRFTSSSDDEGLELSWQDVSRELSAA